MEVFCTTILRSKEFFEAFRKKFIDVYEFGKGFKKIVYQSFHCTEDHETTIRKKLHKIDLRERCAGEILGCLENFPFKPEQD